MCKYDRLITDARSNKVGVGTGLRVRTGLGVGTGLRVGLTYPIIAMKMPVTFLMSAFFYEQKKEGK